MSIRYLTAAVVFMGFSCAAATNLLSNGTFESGTLSGWTNSGSSTSIADKHEGAWSARITTGKITQTFPTATGQTYKVTAWVRIASETGTDWGGFQAAATTTQDWVNLAEIYPITQSAYGSQWFKLAFTFKATGATSGVKFAYFGGPGRSMTVHVDDVQVFLKGANQAPVFTASLTPTSLAADGTQTFSISGDDPDGAITNVDWNFGDGTQAQGFTGTHRAALPGTYTATVRAGDDDGALSTQTFAWTCTGSGPAIAMTAPTDGVTVSSNSIVVSGTSSSAAGVRVSSDRQQSVVATGTANWSATLPLLPGWNRILAQAQDANGKSRDCGAESSLRAGGGARGVERGGKRCYG